MKHILQAIYMMALSGLCAELPAQTFRKVLDFNASNNSIGGKVISYQDGILLNVSAICHDDDQQCTGISKTDSAGNILWETFLQETFPGTRESVITAGDSIFKLTQATGPEGIAIHCFDNEGVYQNHWTYGAEHTNEFGGSIALYGEGFLMSGVIRASPATDTGFLFFINRDMTLRRKVLFPRNGILKAFTESWPVQLQNGDIIGATTKTLPDSYRYGVINKIDSLGAIRWITTFDPEGLFVEGTVFATATPDGGIAANWARNSHTSAISREVPVVYKLDEDGDIVWETPFYVPRQRSITVGNLFTVSNGDIIGLGSFDDREFNGTNEEVSCSWIFRISPQGEVLWERRICELQSQWKMSGLLSGAELPDGSLAFTGFYADTIPDMGPNSYRLRTYLLRVASDGCLQPGCDTLTVVTSTSEALPAPTPKLPVLDISPNPASQSTVVGFDGVELPVGAQLRIYDALARTVTEVPIPLGSTSLALSVHDWPPGVYLLHIERGGIVYARGKLVKGQ
jgi:hypothetical protein